MQGFMPRLVHATLAVIIALTAAFPSYAQLDGALPIPVLEGVQVSAAVSYDSVQQIYEYRYTVTNPASNTGVIDSFYVDIRSAGPAYGDPAALTIEFRDRSETFLELSQRRTQAMVPVGLSANSGWDGGVWNRGGAGFTTRGPTRQSGDRIPPGQSRSGFLLKSFSTPTIREMTLLPDWIYVSTSPDGVSDEEVARAREIEAGLPDRVFTLGPSAVFPGSFEHWNEMRDSLQRSIALGWVSDSALAQALTIQLASARSAYNAYDGTLAKNRLRQLLSMLAASTATQRRTEFNDLVLLNAQSIIDNGPDTPTPYEPKVTFAPATTSLTIGSTYTLTAQAINLGNNEPLSNFRLRFAVTEGPNVSRLAFVNTGADGKAVFSFVGRTVGRDRILVSIPGEGSTRVGDAEVIWTAGSDLAVPLFAPPVLRSKGGNNAVIHDVTVNISEQTASPPSVTRYYLGNSSPVDIGTAVVLGQRSVPALAPGELNTGPEIQVQLPAGLAQGTHYLAACADAPGAVVELDEANNCSFNDVEGFLAVVVPVEAAASVCTANSAISAGFNSTAVPAGYYIWFNSNFTATGIPSSGTTLTLSNSTITLNGVSLNAPGATITFSPSATCVSTTYDASTNTFITTSPLSGSDEIFLTGLAFPVPSGLNVKSATANWSGQFGSETAGVTIKWKWGAAAYSNFSTDYNAVAPQAAHGNACGIKSSDHAGTPEGKASSGVLFKKYVVGGARGGGGSNWTGSWSGTKSITPTCN